MRKLILSPFLFALIIFFTACNEEPIETSKNNVQFSIIQKSISNGRQLEETPSSVILSIENQANEKVIENEKYNLTKINENYLIDPILLELGDYKLTKFLVLNDAEEVIYATPLSGSNLASFVNSPLPLDFDIIADSATNVGVEVIYTGSIDPEDLGYASLSFNIIPTSDILFSVFGYNEMNNNFSFLSGELTVSGDQDSLLTVAYGDSINVVKIRNDYDILTFDFSADGYINSSINISTDTLYKYKTTPLEVILQSEQNLFAFFPFNGNSTEVAKTGLSGTNNGAFLTTDRNQVENRAFEFDGINDNINYGDNFDLGLSDFTVSVWTKVDEYKGLKPNTSTRGAYIINKGLTKYGTPSRSGYGIIAMSLNNENTFGFYVGGNDQVYMTRAANNFNINEWYHVVGVKEGNIISLYVNGVKIDELSIPSSLDTDTNIPFAIGSQDKLGMDAEGTTYFDGKIDNIKIYDRAFTPQEISDLYNN